MFGTKKPSIFKPLHLWTPRAYINLGFTLKHQLYYTELYKLSPDVIFHMVNFHEPWDSIGKCFFMLEKLLSLSFY